MVWKQDLAKLKKDLAAEGGAATKAPPPKPVPVLEAPKAIEDEDALFLAAMGKAPKRPVSKAASVVPPPQVAAAPVEPVPAPAEDFTQAMGGLKGFRRLEMEPVRKAAAAPAKVPVAPEPKAPAPEPPPAELPVPALPEIPAPPPAEAPAGPLLIQLAAGMAIEVDGSLDLRGHSPADGLERLRERVQDACFLGWRTLHVQLGTDPALREAFLAYLGTPEARPLGRYAQAPIPMGGTQAWILYLTPTPKPEA